VQPAEFVVKTMEEIEAAACDQLAICRNGDLIFRGYDHGRRVSEPAIGIAGDQLICRDQHSPFDLHPAHRHIGVAGAPGAACISDDPYPMLPGKQSQHNGLHAPFRDGAENHHVIGGYNVQEQIQLGIEQEVARTLYQNDLLKPVKGIRWYIERAVVMYDRPPRQKRDRDLALAH
jgi:hypothetical protein